MTGWSRTGGHAGRQSPFALMQEIRSWYAGPLALAGAIATGRAVLAAQVLGADFAYCGSMFIAAQEARASAGYKQAVVDAGAEDVLYTRAITGVHGNYLRASLVAAGLDPDQIEQADPPSMDFAAAASGAKAWKDIWGAGQGVGAVHAVEPAAVQVQRLVDGYHAARASLG